MPAATGITLTGATWLTADAGAALADGKPARVARLQSSGSAAVKMAFSMGFKPRVIAVLGLRGVAPGTAIRATAAGILGGNAGTAVATRLADGTVAAWIVTAGTVSTAEITITISAAGVIDVGELVAMPAVEIEINRDWEDGYVDPSELTMSRGSQPASLARVPYRTLQAVLSPQGLARARAGALDGNMDWQRLRVAMAGGQRMLAVPRWRDSQGAIDSTEVAATALYGVATLAPIQHLGGNYYGSDISVQEVPAIA